MHGHEKSDPAIVAGTTPNAAGEAAGEADERRAGTKGNAGQHDTHRTPSRDRVTQRLERVRQAVRANPGERFTALLHHVSVDTLRAAFRALRRTAAPGVDGMTWADYEVDLELRLE